MALQQLAADAVQSFGGGIPVLPVRRRADQGTEQAAAGLIGQARKKNPNVNPAKVRETCLELIRAM